jgi:hypothetical protein
VALAPAIIHLIGHPAVGKYTVAKALVAEATARGERIVLMDNHATGNLILPLLDLEGVDPVPNEVWDRVGEVREVVYRTIADMSPPAWTFVFTNVLVEDDPGDRAVVARLSRLADESGRVYAPVRLGCDLGVHLERVTSPERGPRHKWIDAVAVERFVRAHDLVDVDALEIDTTRDPPERVAAAILAHLHELGPGPGRVTAPG